MSTNKDTQYNKVPVIENGDKNPVDIPSSYGYGIRHVQLLLASASLTIAFIARSHIGVTVVAMTNRPHSINSHSDNTTELNNSLIKNNIYNTTVWEDVDYDNITIDEGFDLDNFTTTKLHSTIFVSENENSITTYDWPKSTQEMILGSFFLGYSLMMFPMGMVGQRWGGKVPIQIGLLINGLASIFTPWLMTWGGWRALCVCRILQGLSQAGFVPAIQIIVSKWSTPGERARFISYVYTGTTLGTIIAFQLSGLLAVSSWGWPANFWVTGSLCLIMLVVMTIFGSASPAEHKTISEEERNYITGKTDHVPVKKGLKVPWKAILTSKRVWATIPTHIGSGLCFIFFFNQTPSYIHYILKVDVKKSGLLSSIPYATNVIANLTYGFLSDFLTNRKILSTANSRKFFNSLSQFGMTLSFLALSLTKTVELAVGCLIVALSLHAAVHCGWMLNHIDLSPNYSATLMSVGNTIVCSLSVLLPVVISYIITDVTNQFQWRIMFYLMASVAFITNVIFVMFMSPDTEPWNNYAYEETETADKTEKDDSA